MAAVETRNVTRDSLFLFADLSFDGQSELVRVKVRNLSAGGMMAEGGVGATTGMTLVAHLRNVGEVRGTVAWVQGNRFGIAFNHEVDAKAVRAPQPVGQSETPRYARPAVAPPMFTEEDGKLRRI